MLERGGTVTNTGTLIGMTGGVEFQSNTVRPTSYLFNSGTIAVTGGGATDFAIRGFTSIDLMTNSGKVHGVVSLFGGNGTDTIDAGNGNDAVFGGAGNDSVMARLGDDSVDGNENNDTVWVWVRSAMIGSWGTEAEICWAVASATMR